MLSEETLPLELHAPKSNSTLKVHMSRFQCKMYLNCLQQPWALWVSKDRCRI